MAISNSLAVIERLGFVQNKIVQHTKAGLMLSEDCRLKMKTHRDSVNGILTRSKRLYDELNTVQYYLNSAIKKTTEFKDDLEAHLRLHDETYNLIKRRDGHLDFVLKMMDVAAFDLRDSWDGVVEKIKGLEAENRNLRERNYQLVSFSSSNHSISYLVQFERNSYFNLLSMWDLWYAFFLCVQKGNFFRKRRAENISEASDDVEFVSHYRRLKVVESRLHFLIFVSLCAYLAYVFEC